VASYSTAILDDIRAAVDIVEFVGRFVNLRKAGANWKGLCPFHGEKTPSFMVNPKKGIFHCFGCGVGGDVFGFMMRQDRLSFPEAVRALAKTAGVTLPEERGTSGDSGRDDLLRAMDLAARFYAEALWKPGGARAQKYLADRGIEPEVARRFGLGYAPDGWDTLLTFMKSEKVAEETLVSAGLAVARDNRAGVYDRFRSRLLFTIRDLQGRVVAFGGRAFGDEQPKYLNSPETPLYTKGNLLYAVDVARESIRTRNRALIVEGYVDCLMAHQHGFTETVAALGTAFTPAQLAMLRRYCDEVVTFFDADAAGQKAAERAQELLEPTSGGFAWAVNRSGSFETAGALRVKVALLPAGHDPDTFLRTAGAAAFSERIAAAKSLRPGADDWRRRHLGSTRPYYRLRPRGPDAVEGLGRRGGGRPVPGGGRAARRGRHAALDRSPAARQLAPQAGGAGRLRLDGTVGVGRRSPADHPPPAVDAGTDHAVAAARGGRCRAPRAARDRGGTQDRPDP